MKRNMSGPPGGLSSASKLSGWSSPTWNVGVFTGSDTTGTGNVMFSNLKSGQLVPRSADQTMPFTGADPTLQNGQVTLNGYSANSDFTQFAAIQCTAPVSAGQVSIPAWVLSTLPPTGTGQNAAGFTFPNAWLWIGQYNNPRVFNAPGLDRGLMTDIFYNGAGLYFQ